MATTTTLRPDQAAEVFKALADEVRLDLLYRIAAVDEMACTTLVEEASVSASTVSYHVKALKAAGLVLVRKEGRNFHYTIEPERFGELINVLSELAER